MRRMTETRKPDVIDVALIDDGPTYRTQDEAWAALASAVSQRHGVDLNGPHPFHVRTVPVASKGNHRMSMMIAYPKICREPEDIKANLAFALFGEIPEALASTAMSSGDLSPLLVPIVGAAT